MKIQPSNTVFTQKWTDQFLSNITVFFILIVLFTLPVFSQGDPAEDDNTTLAIEAFNTGQDHHEKGELKEALEFYQKALKLMPQFPEAELQLGSAYLSLGQTDEAESAFRRAVGLREDWTLAMANLGSVLVTKKNFTEAEPLLVKAIELDEMNIPAYSALTELKLSTNAAKPELEGLLAKIVNITSKAKPPASMWASRGAIELKLGDLSSAMRSADKSLEIDPKSNAALSLGANSALAANDPKKAALYAARIRSSGDNSDSFKIMNARILAMDGKNSEALAILGTISPNNKEAAELTDKIKLGSTRDVNLVEKQLEESPNDITLIARLCHLYRLSSPEKAMLNCRKAYEMEPNNIEHAIGFGAALVQAKQHPQAVALLREILKSVPDNNTVRANLGTALFQMKNYTEAKVEFNWLIEKQPDLKIAYYFLAICHDHLGEYLDAMANYQQFMKLADQKNDVDEIERVKLRLPTLEKQIKQKRSK